ncbi:MULTISPECIES: hypothetical protein [Chitinophaga]|nr:hypothetical protein [Chitinophaga polysaccharea]
MAQKAIVKLRTKLVVGTGKGAWTYIIWDGVGDTFGPRPGFRSRY